MNNKIKYLLILVLGFCFTSTFAQKRISGHVFSKADGPVMMANVVEKDKNGRIISATQTDVSGNFSLSIKSADNTLEISYIGYAKKTIRPIGERSSFRVELVDAHTLRAAEVKTVKKVKSNGLVIPERELSIASQTLDMDNMEGLSFETAGEALQGQIAGLDIVMNSGNLGAGTSMRLRGTSSINGTQEPLIVVNGYIMEDFNTQDLDMNNLDNEEQFATLLQVSPDDIQSIKVLKDAAATAVWGSRGSNGVIEITTRRGKRGKTNVSFNYRFSGAWQPEGMKMLDGDGYTMMLKEAYFNPHQSDDASSIVELMYLQDHPAYYANYNKNTDWIDAVTQFGQTHNISMAVSGGGEKATFRVSGSYDYETGTIIKQNLNRLTTRLALDYYVSDRIKFTSDFSLTYTKNNKNYDNILGKAYNAMPNMSITRWDYDNETGQYYDSGEYFLMPKAASSAGLVSNNSGLSSKYLSDMVANGNPVALANLAKVMQSTYTITPQFAIEYKLLGKTDEEWQLDYRGDVYMNAYTETTDRYKPAALEYNDWSAGVNNTSNFEFKSFNFTTRHQLVLRPHFENEDHSLQVLGRFEISSSNSTSQNISSSGINGGITDPTVPGYLTGLSTSTSKGHGASALGTLHYAFGSKYIVDLTVRADGSTKFGKGNKWGVFPGVSFRWNISDEKFFQPLKKVVSMLAFRPGWGITGNAWFSEGLIYNKYGSSGLGNYNDVSAIAPLNLKLEQIRWEKTSSWNLGFNLNLLDDLLQFDLNIYNKRTTDLLMSGVKIPSTTGYSSLSNANVGEMENKGWELFVNTRPILKVGKFSAVFRFNIAQNLNTIKDMDSNVLSSMNSEMNYSSANENYLSRVQIGNALGGIYGFHYKGVYVYDYDHNGYFINDDKNQYYDTDGNPNTGKYALENGYAGVNKYNVAPIAHDANGNVIYDKSGNPLPMIYNYGGVNYQFQGGDAVYEDVNHDGQIDELDIQYLGSSNPKISGGFGIDLTYGRWTLKTNFNFRIGNKIINLARMYAEDMRTNKNQSAAVNWRWRKNGQVTEIPRAMSTNIDDSYNSLPSDRYVESGNYLRWQYLQLRYNFDPKVLKKAGFSSLAMAFSVNNILCWSKYSGADPDHTQSGYGPCIDSNQTPRSKSFTFNLSFGF